MQYYILHDMGYTFADNMRDLTPIQMYYLQYCRHLENEEKKKQMDEARNNKGGYGSKKPNAGMKRANKETLKQKLKNRKNK